MDADPTIYPVMEKMGEDILHRWIVELLRPLVARWLESRGIQALVGADQFIYFKQHDPHQRISPDVYVLP
ncbi:MAG TPA: Uma2 family endonuclease, partial [Polyangiaceae bacterium]